MITKAKLKKELTTIILRNNLSVTQKYRITFKRQIDFLR